jgi:hypothetical protein
VLALGFQLGAQHAAWSVGQTRWVAMCGQSAIGMDTAACAACNMLSLMACHADTTLSTKGCCHMM